LQRHGVGRAPLVGLATSGEHHRRGCV
jgi:hypothetical protein